VLDVTSPAADVNVPLWLDGSGGTPTKPVATATTCAFPTGVSSLNVDIGASDVYADTCGTTIPANMFDFNKGAVQVMEFAVNASSGEFSISQDAAYAVMGWGGTMYSVGPWTDYTQIFIRTSNPLSGTEGMIASAIGLLPTRWLATVGDAGAAQMLAKGGQVATKLQTTTSAAKSLGILAASVIDPNKGAAVLNDAGVVTGGGLRPLAFQAKDQDCSYYADSTGSTFDKINVRQGRYVIWGAHHWVTKVAASDAALPTAVGSGSQGNDAAVQTVINHLMHLNVSAGVDQDMITAESQTYDVPLCAMQVTRTAEVTSGGDAGEMSYQPPKGCGCYFESVANGAAPASCIPCGTDAGACPSSAPSCNYGFCEVQ
jgi:hypothetical protein